jgi:hypothetical protein
MHCFSLWVSVCARSLSPIDEVFDLEQRPGSSQAFFETSEDKVIKLEGHPLYYYKVKNAEG